MTFTKTKNATIVFAIAVMMMAMPLTMQTANADTIITEVGKACGFSINEAPTFGAITRGDAVVTEQSVVFTPTPTSTGLGTIKVLATDWIGDGKRAFGTIKLAGSLTGEDVVVGSQTYSSGATEAGTTWTFAGTPVEDAASLARVITATDAANVRAYTSGTDTVTIEAQTRGTGGNNLDFTTTVTGATLTTAGTNKLGNGGDGATFHIQGELTKFNIVGDDGTSTGVNYATKSKSMPAADVVIAQDMLSGIDTTKVVNLSMEFNTAFLTAATGTVTFAAIGVVGDTVTINGITYTAAAATSGKSFAIGTTATTSAEALVVVLNAIDGANLSATNTDEVVTITFDTLGTGGNIIKMAETGANIAVSNPTLTGGTEVLENLPYDGALTQTLTFSLGCI